MSDLILFSLNAILVYLLSDWILRLVERKRGAVIKQRQIVFFVIFLALALLFLDDRPVQVGLLAPDLDRDVSFELRLPKRKAQNVTLTKTQQTKPAEPAKET